MIRPLRCVLALLGTLSLSIAGCTLNTAKRIDEAADLAAQRLGHKPVWNQPWESSPPDWSAGEILPLADAVRLALQNNRPLRADLESIGQADADLLQAGLMKNPVLNFMVMFPAGGGGSMLRANGLPMQPLQDLWLIPARKEVATAQLQQAILRVADRAIDTAAAVKSAYVKLQFTQRAIALTNENLHLADESTRIIQTRQAAGQATQVAVNLAHIRYLRLRSELLALEAEYRAGQRDLLNLVGFAAAPDHWTVPPLHETDDALTTPAAEPDLVALGNDQRLDLQAARWSVRAAERRIKLMQREGWPNFALGGSFERAPTAPAARGPTVPARIGNAAAQAITNRIYGVPNTPLAPQIAPWQPKMNALTWTVGPMFELELPIFDHNQAQVAKAAHEYAQKVAEYEARAQESTRDIRTALVNQRQAYEQVEFYRSAVLPEVERNLGLAQQAFIAGQEGLTVYLQAQEDTIMTRRTILAFLRDYYLSGIALERAVGGKLDLPAPTTATAPTSQESAHD